VTAPSEISSCEVCGNAELKPVLNLGPHPLCDDLVPVGDARQCNEYPIEILFCPRCITAHQRFQVPKRELFPKTYHYRSRFTADVLNGMKMLVDSCVERLGRLEGKTVLDVGCNDGSLLDFFKEKGAKTIGVEPTGAYSDGLGKGHELYNDFFAQSTAARILAEHGRPDVVTFTNVFAHIEDLAGLLSALRVLTGPHTAIVVENHYLGAVLDRHQFDTFYHEHPRTYSTTSFKYIAEALGKAISGVEFPSRYGGNIRVFMGASAVAASDGLARVFDRETDYLRRFSRLERDVMVWKAEMSGRVAKLVRAHGPLPAKAFPGRAAILIKLLGLDCDAIDRVYEKPGSMKIGHYLPGTRIPIASDDDFFARPDKLPVMVNLAWHIAEEIKAYLRKRGYEGEVIDILDPRNLDAQG